MSWRYCLGKGAAPALPGAGPWEKERRRVVREKDENVVDFKKFILVWIICISKWVILFLYFDKMSFFYRCDYEILMARPVIFLFNFFVTLLSLYPFSYNNLLSNHISLPLLPSLTLSFPLSLPFFPILFHHSFPIFSLIQLCYKTWRIHSILIQRIMVKVLFGTFAESAETTTV